MVNVLLYLTVFRQDPWLRGGT